MPRQQRKHPWQLFIRDLLFEKRVQAFQTRRREAHRLWFRLNDLVRPFQNILLSGRGKCQNEDNRKGRADTR